MDIINNCLSEDTAMTIILFYFNEMSVKEIAERLGIPQGTVLSRLNYAKKVIKKEVEKYEKDNKDKLFAVIVPFLTLLFKKDPDHYHVYEYDNQGRLVLDTEYSYEYDKSYWYCEYVYENDGTYTTHVTYFDVLKQDMVTSKDYEQYSADGTLLLTQTGVRSQIEVYNYDKNGVLQTVDIYYGKTLHQTTTYEYDNQGRLVRDYTAFTKSDAYKENIYTYKDL